MTKEEVHNLLMSIKDGNTEYIAVNGVDHYLTLVERYICIDNRYICDISTPLDIQVIRLQSYIAGMRHA
jgi:lipopolysaccharide/colanic/teichoic acid biosynthesis glycosyltransferase